MNIKVVILLILISSIALAQFDVTLEEAQQVVAQYQYDGESLDIKPATLTYHGSDAFWVLEIVSLGQLKVMIPVDAETGTIDKTTDIKPVLKTHYLANFFETDTTISDYLDSELSYAQNKKDDFSSAKSELEVYEPQLEDANITLLTLNSLKDAIDNANNANDNFREQIINTQALLIGVNDQTDITVTQNALNSFFSKQDDFFNDLEDTATEAGDFEAEIAGNNELKINYQSLAVALQAIVNTYNLKEPLTTKQDTATQNKNTIDSFYAGLDDKADEFYIKLEARIDQSAQEQERREVIETISEYNDQYNTLNADGASLPESYRISSGFESDIDEIYELLNESYLLCASTDISICTNARNNFNDIESLITALQSDIDSYVPACTSGTTQYCTTDSGERGTQTCSNSVWGNCIPIESGGLNWNLIFILVGVLAVVILFKFKDKIFKGGEKGEKPVQRKSRSYLDIYKR